jgi:hypothetical protein
MTGSRPRRWVWLIPGIAVPLQLFWLGFETTYERTYYCSDCGELRHTREVLGKIAVSSRQERSTASSVLPAPEHDHSWVYVRGHDSWGEPMRGPGLRRWNRVLEMLVLGCDNPETARWLLKNDVTDAAWEEWKQTQLDPAARPDPAHS